MKFFLLSLYLFCQVSYAEQSCYSKKESKEYFYINGVWNKNKETAQKSVKSLESSLEISQEINLLYNESEGWLADIEETFGFINFNKKEKQFPITFFSQKKYASKSKDFYSRLSKDKINIIIAHSEGNLFAERICQINDEKKIIENIAIAPPLEKLSCNTLGTYVLYDTDFVINKIDVLKRNFKELPPTHKKGLDLSHSLQSYLDTREIVNYLKNNINLTINKVYNKNFNFPLATLEIEENGEFKKLINNLEDKKDSVVLWSREKQAFLNVVSYSTELASNLNRKGFIKKILDTEIPAQDEQDFADMIAYSLNSLNSYCKTVFPKRLQPLCSKVGVKDYFNQKEIIEPSLAYDNIKDWKISIPCPIASQSVGKTLPISLIFQKRMPSVLFNKEPIELNYEVETDKVISLNIGKMNISKNENEQVNIDFKPSNLENKPKEEYKDKLSQCNSLTKLGSEPCKGFLKYIDNKYFTKK